MSTQTTLATTGLTAVMLIGTTIVAAYEMDWHTIDGGGGTSAGGTYELTCGIGQPDARSHPGPMAGGRYELTGGFWATPVYQGVPADLDGDGDVDKDDLRAFDACANECICANVNCDAAGVNVVDLQHVKNHIFCTDQMDTDCILSDVNRDGNVNVVDLQDVKNAVFCRDTSVNVRPGCEWADFDGDNDVDANDYATMQGCISGPNVPVDPDCVKLP